MNAFEQYLRSGDRTTGADAAKLRSLGRRAAAEFTEKQIPLNESIRKFSKEAKLNDEQTKRVLEFANNQAFSTMFKAGFNQNIRFPLADADKILQKEVPVPKTKQAEAIMHTGRYIPGQEQVSLEDAFEAGLHKEADAEVEDTHANTLKWLDKTAEVKSLKADLEGVADAFMLKLAHLDTTIQHALSEGHPAHVIGACIAGAGPGMKLARFLHERYGDSADVPNGLDKLAQDEVLAQNPITDTVQKLEELAQQLAQTQEAVSQAQQLVDHMLQTMQTPIEESPADKLFRASAPPPPEQMQPPAEQMPQGQMPPEQAQQGQMQQGQMQQGQMPPGMM